MIPSNAVLSIAKIPLERIQIKEFQQRYPDRLAHYIALLSNHPDSYAGLLSVVPSDTHGGMYALLDGHHRFAASLMTGRKDALCVVIEEPEKS